MLKNIEPAVNANLVVADRADLENPGAAALQFTPAELAERNSAVPAIKVRPRLPEVVEVMSGGRSRS